MKNLLVVTHCPSTNTEKMRDALLAGANHADITDVEVRSLAPLATNPEDAIWADAIVIGTTENFGYMAGRIKDFFERIYYPVLEEKQGLPYALYIRAGNDGTGTKNSIERIIAGLKWNPVQPPLICKGEFKEEFITQCEELGLTVSAGLEAGIY